MKKLLILKLLLVINYASWSQISTNSATQIKKVFNTKQLKEDFSIFRGSLEAIHPGLYRYSTTREMDTYFDLGYESLNHPMTEIEFIKKLAWIISKYRLLSI